MFQHNLETVSSLNSVSSNIKGINNPRKRKNIFGTIKEITMYTISYGRRNKIGVAILFKRSVHFNNEKVQNIEGCYRMLIGTIAGPQITFLNVYAPYEDCPQFFKRRGCYTHGGEFNCI